MSAPSTPVPALPSPHFPPPRRPRARSARAPIVLVAVVLTSYATAYAQAQWQPPIGVPRPPFGVDEVRPSAPTLIVNGGTTQSIPGPVPAGAVVEIRGTYSKNHTSPNTVNCQGTASQPAFIYGAPGAVVTGEWEIKGSYCIIEKLKFSGGAGWTFLGPGDHLALRDSEVQGDLGWGGFRVQTWDASVLQYVVLLRNYVHHNGDVNTSSDQDVFGTSLYRSSGTTGSIHHIWILDSEYSYNSGDGIQINGNHDSTKMHHIYVGRVHAHHNQQGGIWTKRASDVVFSQNTVHAHRTGVSGLGHCVGYQYGPERVWFLFNQLYDCEKGIMSGGDLGSSGPDGTEVHAVGNVIHDLVPSANGGSAYTNAGIMIAGSQSWTIANNTFWNVPVGVAWPNGGGAIRIEGNVFGPFNLASGSAIFAEQPPASRPYIVTGNVFQKAFFRLGGYGSTFGISRFPGNREMDPLLFSPPSDFHLQANSPAIDYAPLSAAYARFQQLYGFSIQVDADNTPRPQLGAVDAGAYEYVPLLRVDDVQVTEGNGGTTTAVFTVRLSQSPQTVTVDYASADGTATSPADYAAISGSLVFPPGTTTRTVTVEVAGDLLDEADETFLLRLTNASGAFLAKPQATGTILDDDPPPVLKIDDVSVAEGEAGISFAEFMLSLSTPSGRSLSVSATTADGTATAGSDYAFGIWSVEFPAGAMVRPLRVAVIGDRIWEADETLLVNLSSPQNVTLADPQGVGTISNDDTQGLSAADLDVVEPAAGTRAAVFTVTLSPASASPAIVSYATAALTATSAVDFTPVSGTLNFNPGATSTVVSVPILADTLVEGVETFRLELSNPSGAAIAYGAATGRIHDPGQYFTLAPCRVLDTREPVGPYGGPALSAGQSRAFTLAGRCGIPASARTVTVNVTVSQPTAQGNLRLYPAGQTMPSTSNLNYVTGRTRANNAIAGLSPAGAMAIHCSQQAGTVHAILDVTGYFE